jgi:hypothetical protein
MYTTDNYIGHKRSLQLKPSPELWLRIPVTKFGLSDLFISSNRICSAEIKPLPVTTRDGRTVSISGSLLTSLASRYQSKRLTYPLNPWE